MNTLRQAIAVLVGKPPTHTSMGERPTREEASEAWKFIDDYTASRADLQTEVVRLREALRVIASGDDSRLEAAQRTARKALEGGDE